MDHIRILRRAFEIVRSYRVLWIFGFLLALTTGGGGGSNSGYQFSDGSRQNSQSGIPLPDGFSLPSGGELQSIVWTLIGVGLLILLLVVGFTIVRYVAETASIRMVDCFEASGEKVRFSEGWKLGWSRAAFRMWLIDFVLGFGLFLVIMLVLAGAALPLLLWLTENTTAGIVGTVAAISMGIGAILILFLIGSVLALFTYFVHRAVALENLGVLAACRRGWIIIRQRPGDAIIMGLILFGIGMLFGIVMIPISLLVVFGGFVAGGIPALLAWAVANAFAHGMVPVVVAIAVGIPIFLVTVILPLTFVSGLFEAFSSSSWTLTYREMVALETTQAR